MSRALLRIVAIGLVMVLALGILTGIVFWRMSAFKTVIVKRLGESLGANVQVSTLDLDWMDGEIHAVGVTLVNLRPAAPWEKASVGQAVIHFSWSQLFSPTIPLSIDVSSWTLVLHPGSAENNGTPLPGDESPAAPAKERIRIDRLTAHDGEVDLQFDTGPAGIFQKVNFEANNNGADVWTTHLQTGSISDGTLQADSSAVDISSGEGKLTFSNFHMKCGAGVVEGEGDIALEAPHARHATLKAVNMPVEMLVATTWQVKVAGAATGGLTYEGSDQGSSAQGQIALSQARFNVLPWIGNITALLNLPSFTDTELDKASADLSWKNSAFEFTHIDIRKEGVARIDGQATVDSVGQVNGKLRLGLPAAVIAKWPDLQTKVFSTTADDYSWADFNLTGTPDKLQEDLSTRVLAVGTQQGSTLLNQAGQAASDWLKSLTK